MGYLKTSSKRFECLGGITLKFCEMSARRQATFMDTHADEPIKAMAIVCGCVEGWESKSPEDLMEELSTAMLTEVSSAIFELSGADDEKKLLESAPIAVSSTG